MDKNEQKVAVMAVNRFMYYSWNYPMKECSFRDGDGYGYGEEYLPEFVVSVPWSFGTDHAVKKWKRAVKHCDDPHAYFSHFYATLDSTNRKRFITWVMANYDDEVKI